LDGLFGFIEKAFCSFEQKAFSNFYLKKITSL
jgi:hypothetical protein